VYCAIIASNEIKINVPAELARWLHGGGKVAAEA